MFTGSTQKKGKQEGKISITSIVTPVAKVFKVCLSSVGASFIVGVERSVHTGRPNQEKLVGPG